MSYMKKINYFIVAMVSAVLLCIATPSRKRTSHTTLLGDNIYMFHNLDVVCR